MTSPDRPLPEVSIIIPYHNCAGLTEACLRSVAAHTGEVAWELVLVDDASTEQPDLSFLDEAHRPQVLRNEARESYSRNNNRAARAARGEFLCLLNNDTYVTPGWLKALVATLRREPAIGVLGNRHLYPSSGLIQHAGMAFDAKGFPVHLNPGVHPDAPATGWLRDFQCVTFACVLIRRSVYEALGGLEESYRNGFEDCDFCLRARAAGHRVTYTPASTIYHYGQSTPGRTLTDDANWKQFQSGWAGLVECDLDRRVEEDARVNRAAAQRTHRRKQPGPGLHLHFDINVANAFTWATVDLIAALQRRGVPMSIPVSTRIDRSIFANKKKMLRSLMSAHPKGTYHLKWSHYWTSHLKTPLSGEVNAEIFCTNYRYRAEGRHLDLWMRHVAVNDYRKLPVSRFNLEALREVGVPEEDCRILPLGYAPEVAALYPDAAALPRKEGRDLNLLLVTNSHDLHRYGTDLAIQALGRSLGPDDPVVVHIKDYGHVVGEDLLQRWIAEQPRFPRVVWHREFLAKDDLIRLYAGMDAQLAPFRGEGFAMKILDAAAVGVPTLMPAFGGPTEFASEGMFLPLPFDEVPVAAGYDRDNMLLGDGAYWCQPQIEPMARLLASLPDRREELAAMGRLGLERVRARFSWDEAARRLMEALQGWASERLVAVAPRRQPDEKPLSVIIPTKDRLATLALTLKAYDRQTLPASSYELILVNDHGDLDSVKALAGQHAALNLRVLDNQGPGGPAAARNLAIDHALGEVVLITGDDIVPREDFLAQHLEAHRHHPSCDTAFVGLTLWHPDLPATPFMDHITGEGGQQFKYDDMKPDAVVPFDRLYTSNCSLKRAFLIEEEHLFSTRYRYAAYEDVELGYRLHLRGMVLRYLGTGVGYHLHEMTPASFLERQRKVGRMLTLLALQRPGFVPNEHTTFLRALEFLRSHDPLQGAPELAAMEGERFVQDLTRAYSSMLALAGMLATPNGRRVVDHERDAWRKWLNQGGVQVWEAINQAILRQGMAEEWAVNEQESARARAWVHALLLPSVTGFKGLDWNMPFARPEFSAFLFPQSKLAYQLSCLVRNTPLVGPMILRLEQSTFGQYLRSALTRLVR